MTAPHALWISLGLLGGSTLLDDRLADYQWSVTPRSAWGVQALAGAGAFATGPRAVQTRTTQRIGVPDPASAAAVRATSVEWVAQGRVAKLASFELLATASGGRMHLGYHPDRIELATGVGSPVVVRLAPVDAWIGGGGVAVRRRLAGAWRGSLSLDRRFFGMDTAHRNGGAIVVGHESFGDWNARFELAWLLLGA